MLLVHRLWEQSALGSGGENMCFDPLGIHTRAMITDVRPKLFDGAWKENVGGGRPHHFHTQCLIDFLARRCVNAATVLPNGAASLVAILDSGRVRFAEGSAATNR
jgi:hypothetical protein